MLAPGNDRQLNALHLCEAAVHEQFRARDVAAVIRREKHHGFRDLIGCPEPTDRNTVGNRLHACLASFCGMPRGVSV